MAKSTPKTRRRVTTKPRKAERPEPALVPAPRPRLLTLSEAAMHLGHVHRTTIMRWVHDGRLKCVRLSRKAILFEPGELERFIREHRYSG